MFAGRGTVITASWRSENSIMAAPKVPPRFTVNQYLSLERRAAERHEYVDGFVWAMAGESGAHADISANIMGSLVTQLKGKPCRARTKDTKVRSGPIPRSPGGDLTGMYSYPDVVVVCGEPVYHDDHEDVVLNPAVIIEVLSPATEKFDRGDKGERYRTWNPTLDAYVLVAQDRPQVEVYTRVGPTEWSHHVYAGLDSTVPLPSIACALKLAEVYDRVTFPPA